MTTFLTNSIKYLSAFIIKMSLSEEKTQLSVMWRVILP